MLKTFLVEDEVVIREMIKKMIPWEQYGFELAGEEMCIRDSVWFYKRDNCKDFYGNIGRETDVQGYSQGYCGAVWSEPEYVLLSFP